MISQDLHELTRSALEPLGLYESWKELAALDDEARADLAARFMVGLVPPTDAQALIEVQFIASDLPAHLSVMETAVVLRPAQEVSQLARLACQLAAPEAHPASYGRAARVIPHHRYLRLASEMPTTAHHRFAMRSRRVLLGKIYTARLHAYSAAGLHHPLEGNHPS